MEPRRDPANLSGFEASLLRDKVFNIVKAKSFNRGQITLASGKESNFYFDMKPTMFSPDGALALSEVIFDRLSGVELDYVGGLAVGALPLVSNLALFSYGKNRPIPGFFVRDKIKDHGTKLLIEGLAKNETLEGKSVVILDDVTTTGASAMKAVKAAQDAGARIVLVLSVVDRGEGADVFYENAGIPFESIFTASQFLES